jgi:hypothetical protein
MTRHDARGSIRLAHLALVAVQLVGVAWIATRLAEIVFYKPEPGCEPYNCSHPSSLLLFVLIPVLVVWLAFIAGQLVLALGPTIRPVLGLLAVADSILVLAGVLGLVRVTDSGQGADGVRLFYGAVIALATTGTLTCLMGLRALRTRGESR